MSPSFLFTKRLGETMLYLTTLIHKHLKRPSSEGNIGNLTISSLFEPHLAPGLDYLELPSVTHIHAGSLFSCRKDVTER
jgi:hypothetical protein